MLSKAHSIFLCFFHLTQAASGPCRLCEADADMSTLLQSRVGTMYPLEAVDNSTDLLGQSAAMACQTWQAFYGLGSLPSVAPKRFRVQCKVGGNSTDTDTSTDACGLSLPGGLSSFMGNTVPKIIPLSAQQNFSLETFNPSLTLLPTILRERMGIGSRYLSTGFNMGQGSLLSVLNESFNVIASDYIEVMDTKKYVNAGSANHSHVMQQVLQDVRLLTTRSGEVLISFTPYILDTLKTLNSHFAGVTWGCNQLIAPLHVDAHADGSFLRAWVDFGESRRLLDGTQCTKNSGFIDNGSNGVLALTQIYPTISAELGHNLSKALSLPATIMIDATVNTHAQKLILPQLYASPGLPADPFTNVLEHRGQWQKHTNIPDFTVKAFLHNGPNPIWIEELQEYLGVGHFKRGTYDAHGNNSCELRPLASGAHHYTQIFFTVKSAPHLQLARIGSTEFCMASVMQETMQYGEVDCDTVQFVSGLVRDGGRLHMGYGVMDKSSRIATLNVSDVISSLVDLIREQDTPSS